MMPAQLTATVHALWPLLVVRDLDRSVHFYREQLGFTIVGQAEADVCVAYYGMRQLFVPEPDGYVICFESPTAQS